MIPHVIFRLYLDFHSYIGDKNRQTDCQKGGCLLTSGAVRRRRRFRQPRTLAADTFSWTASSPQEIWSHMEGTRDLCDWTEMRIYQRLLYACLPVLVLGPPPACG
jgi:hypothetical protein